MKKYLWPIILLVMALAVAGGMWKAHQDQVYRESHVFLEEDVYPIDAKHLDLRGQEISQDYYDRLQALLPECRILWDVPFQGGKLSSDVTELTLTTLSDGDLAQLLACFPELETVHAGDCTDYAQLAALREAEPAWDIRYEVKLCGGSYPLDTTALNVEEDEAAELMERLQYLPELTHVHFPEPQMEADALLALTESYPNIQFTWEKTILGDPYSNDLTELDLSGIQLDGVEQLEEELRYFPKLEKLLLCQSSLDNETLAAYRDRAREHYKVVWSVKLGRYWTRTDAETYMPIREGDHVMDQHLKDLKYCEDLIVVDLGHMGVIDTEWIYHTPKLQFLILADTDVSDITPIGTLKELIYLELFKSPRITDYTPLLGCTALQDLNLAFTNGNVDVLAQMTWLDALWANYCGATAEQKQNLRDSLPNTLLELDHGWHMGNGWRDRPNYYVMRDILQMPYYDWGSKRLIEENKKRYG